MPGQANGPALFVASTGGHLAELHQLRRRLSPAPGAVEWVTHQGDQVQSLLAGEVVHIVPYVGPRKYTSLASNMLPALRILRAQRYSMIVTTGAGVALPFAALAQTRRIPFHYIESAARSESPSFTGSLTARMGGVKLYTQYPGWANGQWQYRGSLFDGFVASEAAAPPRAGRVVVTLGTMRTFGFRRALEAVVQVLPSVLAPDGEVLWQTGCSDTTGLGIKAHTTVPARDLETAIAEADLVIAHAGVGSALTALQAGRRPLLLPRTALHHEHIDNHQSLIARELGRRRLAVAARPETLGTHHLADALQGTARAVVTPPAFDLQ